MIIAGPVVYASSVVIKWSHDHHCSEIVQLHVLQEFWDICHSEDSAECSAESADNGEAQVFLPISFSAMSSKSATNAIQFQGLVQGQPARVLLDSGSSHTFISTQFAAHLHGQASFSPALQVKIADGKFLDCSSEFKQLDWSVQGCTFQSVAKVIPLAQYDLIVGMDWLSQFSPMEVDWHNKWLKIPYGAFSQFLQGDLQELPMGTIIQISVRNTVDSLEHSAALPVEITQLHQEFWSVFDPPSGYPPPQECEHEIPLFPGATPVSVRPYRYPPAVKDEIETPDCGHA